MRGELCANTFNISCATHDWERFATPLSASTGRKIHLILMCLWIVPGLPVSWYLRESVPWLVFLSVYAIVVGHASGWSAERPTEIEGEENN